MRYPNSTIFGTNVNDTPNILLSEIRGALHRIGRRRTYAAGTVLFVAGELPKGIYLIENGGAITVRLSPSAHRDVRMADGRTEILLGLSETISGQAHKFTAQATESCDVVCVEREAFVEFLRENQVFCLKIVRFLSENLHQLYYALQQQSSGSLRGRRANS